MTLFRRFIIDDTDTPAPPVDKELLKTAQKNRKHREEYVKRRKHQVWLRDNNLNAPVRRDHVAFKPKDSSREQ